MRNETHSTWHMHKYLANYSTLMTFHDISCFIRKSQGRLGKLMLDSSGDSRFWRSTFVNWKWLLFRSTEISSFCKIFCANVRKMYLQSFWVTFPRDVRDCTQLVQSARWKRFVWMCLLLKKKVASLHHVHTKGQVMSCDDI